MIRAGILSGAYKFKALTLDKSGTAFIVMFDLQSPDLTAQPDLQGQLERNLQNHTQSRLGITVKAVYWRHGPQLVTNDRPSSNHPAFAKTRPLIRPTDDTPPHPLSDTQLGQLGDS